MKAKLIKFKSFTDEGIIEADDIQIVEERPKERELRDSDIILKDVNSCVFAWVDGSFSLTWIEKKDCNIYYPDKPVLFNLADLVTEMQKAKDGETEKIFVNHGEGIIAVTYKDEQAEKISINLPLGWSTFGMKKSDAFRFAAQLLGLCRA